MTIERAKSFGWAIVSGFGTLKKAALVEILETLLNEIERLQKQDSSANSSEGK